MKRVLIFGGTGSIGTQTCEICAKHGFKIVGITYHSQRLLALNLQNQYKINHILDSSEIEGSVEKAYTDLIKKCKPNIIVNAIVGFAGLDATMAAIKSKIDLALANKESLVVAGKIVMDLARKNNVRVIPIDSEHTSLMQTILWLKSRKVKPEFLYITASGGKFYNHSKKDLGKVSYTQATSHPNWSMGNKITIDSNTLMNKCFELIEAYWYFKTKNVMALYHPDSIVHSIVQVNDCNFFANIYKPTMKVAIELALRDFTGNDNFIHKWMILKNHKYNINEINTFIHKPIKWAQYILENPNNLSKPIVLNTANEVAIELFKQKKIRFDQIIDLIELSLMTFETKQPIKTIKDVKKFDQLVRKQASERKFISLLNINDKICK